VGCQEPEMVGLTVLVSLPASVAGPFDSLGLRRKC
jgi:hypothetical protein